MIPAGLGFNDLKSRTHDNAIIWKPFPFYRPFVRGIYHSPMASPIKRPWCGTLTISLLLAWTNLSTNSRFIDDFIHNYAHAASLWYFCICHRDLGFGYNLKSCTCSHCRYPRLRVKLTWSVPTCQHPYPSVYPTRSSSNSSMVASETTRRPPTTTTTAGKVPWRHNRPISQILLCIILIVQ